MMRFIRLFLMRLGVRPPLVTDDYSFVGGWCRKCGGVKIVIRPGDFRCSNCEN